MSARVPPTRKALDPRRNARSMSTDADDDQDEVCDERLDQASVFEIRQRSGSRDGLADADHQDERRPEAAQARAALRGRVVDRSCLPEPDHAEHDRDADPPERLEHDFHDRARLTAVNERSDGPKTGLAKEADQCRGKCRAGQQDRELCRRRRQGPTERERRRPATAREATTGHDRVVASDQIGDEPRSRGRVDRRDERGDTGAATPAVIATAEVRRDQPRRPPR